MSSWKSERRMPMRDVEKTRIQDDKNLRRNRRRDRGKVLYAILVFLFAAGLIVTLSMTVLFNIESIEVTGDAKMYKAEEIAQATGISAGDNLIRIDIEKAEQKALDKLINVEEISIKRRFPNTLLIDVKKCTPAYNIKYEYGVLVTSQSGKIIENSMNPREGLVTIVGYNAKDPEAGKWIYSEDVRDTKILEAFMKLINDGELEYPIVAVDMTKANNIVVNLDNRFQFDMGNWEEIDYKISFAQSVISKQPADKEGYLTMIGNNQVSFRNKADVERQPETPTESPAETTTGIPEETKPEVPTLPEMQPSTQVQTTTQTQTSTKPVE